MGDEPFVPSLWLNVRVTSLPSQRAQNVVAVSGVIEAAVICVPPVEFGVSNQPTKVNPGLLTGVSKVPFGSPADFVSVLVGSPLPIVPLSTQPFALKVISICGVHLAKYVVLEGGTVEFASRRVPPVGDEYHPAKSYPALDTDVGKDPKLAPG